VLVNGEVEGVVTSDVVPAIALETFYRAAGCRKERERERVQHVLFIWGSFFSHERIQIILHH